METDAELKQIQIDKYTRKQAEQFGIENRLLQCTEECGEFIQALSKYQRIKVTSAEIIVANTKGARKKQTIL